MNCAVLVCRADRFCRREDLSANCCKKGFAALISTHEEPSLKKAPRPRTIQRRSDDSGKGKQGQYCTVDQQLAVTTAASYFSLA